MNEARNRNKEMCIYKITLVWYECAGTRTHETRAHAPERSSSRGSNSLCDNLNIKLLLMKPKKYQNVNRWHDSFHLALNTQPICKM